MTEILATSVPTPDVEVTGPRFTMTPEALLYDPTIGTTAKAVYAVLRRHGETPTNCYPSRERIGALLGIASRSVQRPVVELENAGWIERRRRFGPDGRELTTGYLVRSCRDDRASERAHPERDDRALERGRGRASERDKRESGLTRENLHTLATPSLGSVVEAPDPLRGFDSFWQAYPARRGRKIGKAKCQARWRKLKLDERRAAWRGARNYAQEVGDFAKDPDRWLRDRCWEDWIDARDISRVEAIGVTPFDSPDDFASNYVYGDPS